MAENGEVKKKRLNKYKPSFALPVLEQNQKNALDEEEKKQVEVIKQQADQVDAPPPAKKQKQEQSVSSSFEM